MSTKESFLKDLTCGSVAGVACCLSGYPFE